MQSELQRVLELQPSWSSTNIGAMDERGRLVRNGVTAWLRSHEVALSAAAGISVSDFFVEGRDGTGRKTRVPWTRFGSRERSPSSTDGFYIVYLWAFDGGAVYLSLNQGTPSRLVSTLTSSPASDAPAWPKAKGRPLRSN